MNPDRLIPLLTRLFKLGERPLLVGPPGCAKTSSVRAAAAQAGMAFLPEVASTWDPTDLQGIPYVGEGRAAFLPAGFIDRLLSIKAPTVVSMEDLGTATHAVQAALLQPILEGEVNGHRISKHVIWCATTNRRTDKAGVNGIITPLLNRFGPVLNVTVDDDSWVRWGVANDMPASLLGYARFRPDVLNAHDANKARDMEPQPSARSLAALGRIINAGIGDFEVWAGTVGEATATEVKAFVDTHDKLPDLREIWRNPGKAPIPGGDDPGVLYALSAALANKGAEHLGALLKYIGRQKFPITFAVLTLKDLMMRDQTGKIIQHEGVLAWISKHRDMFEGLQEVAE